MEKDKKKCLTALTCKRYLQYNQYKLSNKKDTIVSDNQNNSNNEINDSISEKTYLAAVERSKRIEADIAVNPKKYRVLTGDRPTGRLHIGHYFGSLQNRVKLSKQGVPTCILIADYQVLTDHDAFSEISQNTKQLVIDYLASGIEPSEDVIISPHSYVREVNQLIIPILTLVCNA